ncbi:MAG: oxidoreductase [Deltaproteobacteria bacterium]|jgi:F420-non-reducing hydrogenase small subunit|nr:oxidoreductase [Deltaproteobacteria bacterium]MBW2530043.1 oxidoreductase [Deltaproteobacteria bacterium]
MADKITMAVSWAAACGGCDVSLLDIEHHLLELAELADIVYWPVAMDFKRAELEARPDGSIDIGIFNGAIRTSEQLADAELFRKKCKLLVAYGACASFGGIPGLGNLVGLQRIVDEAYAETPSTDNPDGVRPVERWPLAGDADGPTLRLPSMLDAVHSLPQAVDVDVIMPGCPPPMERVLDLVAVAKRYAESGELPPEGAVLASDKALCDQCPRNEGRAGGRLAQVVRPHEALADRDRCFLDQGMLCLGISTRGGCGATCITANMPCRGCFGPTDAMLDPGAEALSAIGSIAGPPTENFVQAHEMKKAIRAIRDPAGTFYRFTLPSSFIHRFTPDEPRAEAPKAKE